MEDQIIIAAKIYKCRTVAKAMCELNGKDFYKTIEPHLHIINEVMKANGVSALKAILKISETSMYQDNAIAQMYFMAALAELIEPSKRNDENRKD